MKLVNAHVYGKEPSELMGGLITRECLFKTLPVIQRILFECGIKTESDDLKECLLGSTGKKAVSSDIDLCVVDITPEHIERLKVRPGVYRVARHGTVVSFVMDIVGYDGDYSGASNGLVQVDLIKGDLKWNKQFYFSCEASAFKGAHRNILINAFICALRTTTEDGVETGPLYSPTRGFCTRVTTPGKKPVVTYHDVVFDVDIMSVRLFDDPRACDSLETLYPAIIKACERRGIEVTDVFKRYVEDYLPLHLISGDYPFETRAPLIWEHVKNRL